MKQNNMDKCWDKALIWLLPMIIQNSYWQYASLLVWMIITFSHKNRWSIILLNGCVIWQFSCYRFVVKINAKDYLAVKLKEIYPQLGLPNMLVFLCLDWKRESLLPVCPCSRKIGHYSKYYKSGQSWLLEKLCQKVLRGELAYLFIFECTYF